MTRWTAAVLALAVASGCSGVSGYERCVDHSVEEGVNVERAEAGCRAAVGED